MSARLSKSKIISGLQCEKRLWLAVRRPELTEYDDATQRRFAAGDAVNDVARALHSGGRLIGFENGVEGAIADTQKALAADPAAPVFEATFAHEGVAVRVDILKKGKRGYRLIEVKSSTEVKPQHRPDCAVQAWVLEENGVNVEKVELAHLDNKFVYRGDNDYRNLFHHEDLTKEIAAEKAEAPQWARRFQEMLEGAQPDIGVGAHCHKPYACPFLAHCNAESGAAAAEYPVACLPGRKEEILEEFAEEGIADIRDIPAGRLRNARQEWVREVTKRGKADVKPGAKSAMDEYEWPRYYLDFETARFAVPVWKGTRPYEALPFQWSCHIETEDGAVTHEEFLGDGAAPMRAFIDSLLRALGTRGTVFMISHYEKRILNAAVAHFPDLAAEINKVIARLVDLQKIASENYYHPDMFGSWSMKVVAPCIAPHLAYDNLGEVREGDAAGVAYLEMISDGVDPARAKKLKEDLLAYCKRDTEAMVELARVLAGK